MSALAIEKNSVSDIAAVIQPGVDTFPSLRQQREEAVNAFVKLGLPAAKHEEFKHTPVKRLLEKSFDFTLANPETKVDNINDFVIPGLEANVIVFLNGQFSKELSTITSPASEVSILNLAEAVEKKSEIVLAHLSKYIDLKTDTFANWNTAVWTNGLFVHVPANTIVGTPIVMYHIHDTSKGQVISNNRNLIVVDENSSVTVLEKFDSIGNASHFSNSVTEGVVARNAELNLYSIQNDSGNRYQYGLTQIYQTDSSRVNTFTFSLNGKLIRNNLQLSLDGENIESHMYGLYLLGGDTLADNHTVVDHRKPNSFSNELYKGIMDGNSKGVFNGKIYVRPQAQKTNAFQSNKNILLTDNAGVNTKPQLEIWADDVKCSHGCTSGQLDEEALFYLQSRGISKETAQAMMLYAFAGELLDNVKHPVIKEYIDKVISERLHKNF
jgi:Fe-S cluster assembly protein SufD